MALIIAPLPVHGSFPRLGIQSKSNGFQDEPRTSPCACVRREKTFTDCSTNKTDVLSNWGGLFVDCRAGRHKTWLPGDISTKCFRTIHKLWSSGISFCQLFCLRTCEICQQNLWGTTQKLLNDIKKKWNSPFYCRICLPGVPARNPSHYLWDWVEIRDSEFPCFKSPFPFSFLLLSRKTENCPQARNGTGAVYPAQTRNPSVLLPCLILVWQLHRKIPGKK